MRDSLPPFVKVVQCVDDPFRPDMRHVLRPLPLMKAQRRLHEAIEPNTPR